MLRVVGRLLSQSRVLSVLPEVGIVANLRVTPSRSELIGDRISPVEAPRRGGRLSTGLSVLQEFGFQQFRRGTKLIEADVLCRNQA